jgi:LPPG:FO 2-phospho-L-lactate transferase
VLEEAQRRGEPDWFQLGDRDLVTHLCRSAALARGDSLTDVTGRLCAALGVDRLILPAADDPRPTIIVTQEGEELAFQRWLVEERAAPPVRAVRYEGCQQTTGRVLEALDSADLAVICPSNPYVSIDPILTLRGVDERLRRIKTVAVSPIIDRKAVKGPLDTMIADIEGGVASAEAVAAHYGDLLDGYAVHPGDRFDAPFPLLETNILIESKAERLILAHELLDFARSLP